MNTTDIRKRADAATPGEWSIELESCDCGGGYPCTHGDWPWALVGPRRVVQSPPDSLSAVYNTHINEVCELRDEDATFIAHARQDIPYLLDTVDALRKDLATCPTDMQYKLAERRVKVLEEALHGVLARYTQLVESGDAGFWDCEKEPEVIAARSALAQARGTP